MREFGGSESSDFTRKFLVSEYIYAVNNGVFKLLPLHSSSIPVRRKA